MYIQILSIPVNITYMLANSSITKPHLCNNQNLETSLF